MKILNEISDIRYVGDPILRTVTKEITKKDFNDGTVDKVVKKIKSSLHKYYKVTKYGVGLSANQIGISKRIFLTRPKLDKNFNVYINPRITKFSKKQVTYPELCLSWGILVTGDIIRSQKIWLEYLDENMKKHKETFEGKLAVLIQHEVGHLYGEVCTDYAHNKSLRFYFGEKLKVKEIK